MIVRLWESAAWSSGSWQRRTQRRARPFRRGQCPPRPGVQWARGEQHRSLPRVVSERRDHRDCSDTGTSDGKPGRSDSLRPQPCVAGRSRTVPAGPGSLPGCAWRRLGACARPPTRSPSASPACDKSGSPCRPVSRLRGRRSPFFRRSASPEHRSRSWMSGATVAYR